MPHDNSSRPLAIERYLSPDGNDQEVEYPECSRVLYEYIRRAFPAVPVGIEDSLARIQRMEGREEVLRVLKFLTEQQE